MDLGLQGKVAVVTGASRGIGAAVAHGLAKEGCRLAICARGQDDLRRTTSALEAEGAEVLALALDLTAGDAAERLTGEIRERFGRVDVLVNNAGGNRRGPFKDLDDEAWEAVLELNFKCHVRVSRSVLPLMGDGGGSILFMASIFGREAGGAGLSIYNSTKSALISLAKIMALELAPQGIRVNSLAPGSTRFPGGSWDRRCLEDPEGMETFVAQHLPLGRFSRADEVADAAVYLSSQRASAITGVCLNVDGGQSRSLI